MLKNILERMETELHENTKYEYYGPATAIELLRQKDREINILKLGRLDDAKKLQ